MDGIRSGFGAVSGELRGAFAGLNDDSFWKVALIWLVLFLFGSAYAWLVYSYLPRKRIKFNTSFLVACGCLVTIVGFGLMVGWEQSIYGYEALSLILACFVATGLPMILGYAFKESYDNNQDEKRSKERIRKTSQQFVRPDQADVNGNGDK